MTMQYEDLENLDCALIEGMKIIEICIRLSQQGVPSKDLSEIITHCNNIASAIDRIVGDPLASTSDEAHSLLSKMLGDMKKG